MIRDWITLAYTLLEQHGERFPRVPPPERWHAETTRRYVNDFVLIGLAGAGKTAFLARQVETLVQKPGETMGRANPNLVLFLRGNDIALRPEGMSLFRDVAEKLDITVEGTATRSGSGGGFSSFRELLEHLHSCWKRATNAMPVWPRFLHAPTPRVSGPYSPSGISRSRERVRPWCIMLWQGTKPEQEGDCAPQAWHTGART